MITRWLASVQSLAEAQSLAATLPDILDMKNPAAGALGALPCSTVAEIVHWVDGRCLTSATVGDLPVQAESIAKAMTDMAATGVDYVKVGLFADQDLVGGIMQLSSTIKILSVPVIAVIFADQPPTQPVVALLKQSGFAGIMVDTVNKNNRGLCDHWSLKQVSQFVNEVKAQQLLCGLAGALKLEDIEPLKACGADYLGFRSALCDRRQRNALLNPQRAMAVKSRLQAAAETCLAS